MERSKISPQEIYEVLEEKNKLMEIREKLRSMLQNVTQTINSLAVENLQLNQSIELSDNEEPTNDIAAPSISSSSHMISSPPDHLAFNHQEQSEIINQQMLEIDLKPCFTNEEIESDEEIHHLQ